MIFLTESRSHVPNGCKHLQGARTLHVVFRLRLSFPSGIVHGWFVWYELIILGSWFPLPFLVLHDQGIGGLCLY